VHVNMTRQSAEGDVRAVCILEANFGFPAQPIFEWEHMPIRSDWYYIFFTNTRELVSRVSTQFSGKPNVICVTSAEVIGKAKEFKNSIAAPTAANS